MITTPRPWLDSYAEGVPHDIELPDGSLYDMLAASVQQYPDNVALEFFGRTTTYAELGAQVDRAAEGLRLLGVQKGDTVALVLPELPPARRRVLRRAEARRDRDRAQPALHAA